VNALVARPLLYSARPAITLDGRDNAALAEAVLSIGVRESAEGLVTLEATFGNWGTRNGSVGFLYFDRSVLDFGKELIVSLGAGDALGQVFHGKITAFEGRFPEGSAPQILVLAEDRLQDLRMTRRTRVFENASVDSIVNDVISSYGIDKTVDVDPLTFPVITQLNQSDLAFLRYVARAADADLWFEGDKLKFISRSKPAAGTPVSIAYGQTLHEFSVCADLAQQRTRLAVSGWDVDAKTALDESVSDEKVQGELDGDDSGTSILKAKFGDRVERIVHEIPLNTDEAKARATAQYRLRARRFVSGRAIGEGDARIKVGGRVKLTGLGPLFTGTYYVTGVHHKFDDRNGYRTEFTVERPGLGRPS
jgi:phage protein D